MRGGTTVSLILGVQSEWNTLNLVQYKNNLKIQLVQPLDIVVRATDYYSEGPGSIPGVTVEFSLKENCPTVFMDLVLYII